MKVNKPQAMEVFAQALARGATQADAYREAFPLSRKWKPESVHAKASHLAAVDKVWTRVKEIQAAAAERTILKIEDVLEETRRLMLATPANLIDEKTGRMKLPHELDAATAAAVASFEIDDVGRVKYKFWDKNSALERAAKILGAFERDNRQKNPLGSLLEKLDGNVIGPGARLVDDEEGDDA